MCQYQHKNPFKPPPQDTGEHGIMTWLTILLVCSVTDANLPSVGVMGNHIHQWTIITSTKEVLRQPASACLDTNNLVLNRFEWFISWIIDGAREQTVGFWWRRDSGKTFQRTWAVIKDQKALIMAWQKSVLSTGRSSSKLWAKGNASRAVVFVFQDELVSGVINHSQLQLGVAHCRFRNTHACVLPSIMLLNNYVTKKNEQILKCMLLCRDWGQAVIN